MTPNVNEPVWCFCKDCDAFIGSQPCLLPLNWSNRKAQGLHKYGAPTHQTRLVTLAQVAA